MRQFHLSILLIIGLCFQGGVCAVNLTAHSTFMHTIEVDSIHAVNLNGTQFSYTKSGNSIGSAADTHIALVNFMPPKLCDWDCAIVYPDRWSPSAIIDYFQAGKTSLLSHKLRIFRRLKTDFESILFHVQTNFIKRYDFNGSIELKWPRLTQDQIVFPVIQTGHEVLQHVDVFNPTNETLMVYYTMHEFTNNLATHLPPEVVSPCWNCFLTRDPVFSFVDSDAQNLRVQSIPPRTRTTLAVKFAAEAAGNFTSLLYLRNNFTIIEAIWLMGKAALPQFKFGNRRPGSRTPLLFELSEKTLFDCHQTNHHTGGYSIKRTFTAKNSGETPIQVETFRIDNFECEGYGFRIMDCAPFELAPNSSRKISISFSPDFTLAMVKKMLYIETSLGFSINYTLLSMISPLCLEACSKSLSRPPWESMLKIVSACIAVVTFLCVLLAAYLDAMSNLQCHLKNISKAKGMLQPALDLRQIGSMKMTSTDGKDKDTAAKVTSTTAGSTTSTATSATAAGTPNTCHNKLNANAKKQKVSCKKRNENVIVENAAKPKPWTIELANKVTEKIMGDKSDDVKAKNASPTDSKSNKKPKEKGRLKLIPNKHDTNNDEEMLSTSTENSNHSDDKPTASRDTTKKVNFTDIFDAKDKQPQQKKVKKVSPQSRGKFSETSPVPSVVEAVTMKVCPLPPKSPVEPEIQPNAITEKKIVAPKSNAVAVEKKPSKKKPDVIETAAVKVVETAKSPVTTKRDSKASKENGPKALPQSNGVQYPSQTSPATVGLPSSPSATSNRVSFSHIVQSPLPSSPSPLATYTAASYTTPRDNVTFNFPDACAVTTPHINQFLPSDLSVFTNKETYERIEPPHSTMDLGPIGTRKTQSNASMWQPMSSNSPLTLSPHDNIIGVNSNHYGNTDQQTNNTNYRNQFTSDDDYFSATNRHTEPSSDQSEQQKQRVWDSALYINVQQQQQQQQHVHNSNDSLHTMSMYLQSQLGQTSNMDQYHRLYNNTWNAEQSYGNHHQQRPQHTDDGRTWSMSPQPTAGHQIRPPPGLGHIVIRNNTEQQMSYSNHVNDPNNMPQFHPFNNTLSNIWSHDTWPTNLTNRNNDSQQQ